MTEPIDRSKFKRPLQRPSGNLPAKVSQEPPKDDDAPAPAGGLARLFDAIAKMLTPKADEDAKSQAPERDPPVFSVLVAAMNGDGADGALSQQLFKAVELQPIFKARPLPKPFVLDSMEDPAQVAAAIAAARQTVALENADLLVWGDVTKDGYRLRLSTAAAPDEDRSGLFGPTTRIELPRQFAEPQLVLLTCAILAAADAVTEVQRAAVRRLLPKAAESLGPLAAKPPIQLAMPQQRTIQLLYGHVCVATAGVVPPSQADEWLQKAIEAYRAAEKRIARTDPAWETGLLRRYVANALTLRAERAKDKALDYLGEAVTEWRIAVESLTKASMPLEWAGAQTRLGVTLHRLDLLTGDTELLREAVQALQAALSVYSRTETPQRWADITHSLAQVLEVYGDQIKSAEVLQRACDACDAVLEIRTRERTPLAWAATQNTLGSALFLLDRHSGGNRHLDDAVAAFAGALEVFQAHGKKGPAQVANRNLAKAQKLAEERRARSVITPHWADE
jgi:tetratricopeptide (TPR) repeat protein